MSEKNFVAYGDAESILTGYANRIKQSPTTFVGTQAQWNALSSSQKAEYELVDITDDSLSPSGHVDWESNGKLGAKNVCPVCVGTTTLNGVTFTVNSDGTISATGTATEFTAFDIATTDMGYIIEDGDYVLSDGLDVHSNNQYTTITIVDQNDVVHYDYANTKDADNDAFSIENSNIKKLYVAVCIGDGHTVSNLVFKPMIRLTTDSDETYQPYAMTNKQITPYVQAISNPNLLDNPWFTVNQRGLSSYTTTWKYTVDRWKMLDLESVAISSNGLTITRGSGTVSNPFFYQLFEDSMSVALDGKTLTMSVLLGDGTILSKSGVYTRGGGWSVISLIDTDHTIWICVSGGVSGSEELSFRIAPYPADSQITIKAVKLELGSVSTLAMDTVSNYQQELAKCQRYFVRYKPTNAFAWIGFGIGQNSATDLQAMMEIPVPMRIKPSISFNKVRLWNHTYAADVSSINVSEQCQNKLYLYITPDSSTVIPGAAPVVIWLDHNYGDYIDISADL